MQALMMHRPLRSIDILSHAAEVFADQCIVSALVEDEIHRRIYPETLARVAQLAHALKGLGIGTGDRIGTLAWNGHRHFELSCGIAGIGAVCHTINPRLSHDQLICNIRHAGDRMLFFDLTFVPLIKTLLPGLPGDLRFVILTDRTHMPETTLDALCYGDLLAGQPTKYDWPECPKRPPRGCAALPARDECPALLAVAAHAARDDRRTHMAPHFADGPLPDDLVWVEDLPLTATGKVSRPTLRDRVADHTHPCLRGARA